MYKHTYVRTVVCMYECMNVCVYVREQPCVGATFIYVSMAILSVKVHKSLFNKKTWCLITRQIERHVIRYVHVYMCE